MDQEWLIVIITIIVAVLFLVYKANEQPTFNPPPPPTKPEPRNMTLQELSIYTGEKQKETYLALRGVIYDVTGSPFY